MAAATPAAASAATNTSASILVVVLGIPPRGAPAGRGTSGGDRRVRWPVPALVVYCLATASYQILSHSNGVRAVAALNRAASSFELA
jgi:hypothetical protein